MDEYVVDVTKHNNLKRYKQALYDSKGRSNNSFAWNLIVNSDATTEDIVKLGCRKGNEKYLEHYLREDGLHQANYETEINKILKEKKLKRENFRSLADYKWYFNNAKDGDLDENRNISKTYIGIIDVVKDTMSPILDTSKMLDFCSTRAISYKTTTDILYGSDYFDKRFVEHLDDKSLDEKLITNRNKVLKFSTKSGYSNPHNIFTYLNNRQNCPRSSIKTVIELADKIILSELIMQSYVGIQDNNQDFVFRPFMKNNVHDLGDKDKMNNNILELMKAEGTLNILLNMGVGIKKSNSYRTIKKTQLGKVHTRTRIMYRNFLKCKTVEERKNIRDLMVEQLNLIACDFGNREYSFEQMDCVKWQDEDFEKSLKTKKEKRDAKGLPKGTKIDLSELELEMD